ncbi:MAG: hypothetical protein ACNS60_18805 [Candidatus Cyclobacteriaceae bacterium M2_1C_046]
MIRKNLKKHLRIKTENLTVNIAFLIFILSLTGCKSEESNNELITLKSPAGSNSAQPNLFATEDGLYISWQTTEDSISALYYSKFQDKQWTSPKKLASGKDWFINWADYPSLAVNNQEKVFSNFLPKSGEGTYAYDIHLTLNQPDTTYKLHEDTTQTEHGFVSAEPLPNGGFITVWLDGRNTGGGHHEHNGAMTLRAAEIDQHGKKVDEWLLDEKVCDCCQTDIAYTEEGPIVVYRNRSNEEVRDNFYTILNNGQWSNPKPLHADNWKIEGCPVNGPSIDAKNKNVAVAYFTATENNPKVNLVLSTDAGESFTSPLTVSSQKVIGRVDVEVTNKDEVWVSWMELENENAILKAASYNFSGELLSEKTIAELAASRKSGFPQMENFQESLYFAWTETGDTTSIKLKRLKIQ